MEINSGGVTVVLRSPVAHLPPPCPRILWGDQPAPALPAALSLQLSVTGPAERGGGESHSHLVQSAQRGLRRGRGGSCVPLHQ